MQVLKGRNQTFLAKFGQSQTGYTVSYQILNADGSVNQAYTTSGVVELGFGEYGIDISFSTTFTGFIRWRAVKASLPTLYASEEFVVLNDFVTDIINILKVETGKWKIINNQMIFYDTDGTTVLYTYNLYDSVGAPSSSEIFERRPV